MKYIITMFLMLFAFNVSYSQWNLIYGGAGYADGFDHIQFVNENTGFSDGFNITRKTTNGGYNWFNVLSAGTGLNTQPVGLFFVTDSIGFHFQTWFSGTEQDGRIWKTTNQGENWSYTDIQEGWMMKNIFFLNQNGYICGQQTNGFPKFSKTTDQGNSWNIVAWNVGTTGAKKIYFINSNTGFIITEDGLWRTINSGNQWNFVQSGNFNSIDFVNQNIGFIAGANFLKTTNSGLNWTSISQSGILTFQFSDEMTGYFIKNNQIFKTINQGSTWVLDFQTTYPLQSIYCKNLLSRYAGGNFQTCFKDSSNGIPNLITPLNGTTLNTLPIVLMWQIYDIIDSIYTVQLSTDVNFTNIIDSENTNSNQHVIPNNIIQNNSTYYWRVRSYHNSWSNIFHFFTSNNITSIGAIQNSKVFSLKQNYPNPFNPTTNIEFTIPKNTFVKLLIYDISGKEIVVLINNNLNLGTYNIKWDASNFSSGIYFYKLITDKFYNIKKMIVIK